MLLLKVGGDLSQGDVGRCGDQSEDFRSVDLDPLGAPVPTLRARRARPRLTPTAHQLDGGRSGDAEPPGSRAATYPLRYGIDQADTKVVG